MLESRDFRLAQQPLYGPRQNKIVANHLFEKNEVIPYLIGILSPLVGKEKETFKKHYSIMVYDNISYVLLGLVSFVNHSCNTNTNVEYIKNYKLGEIHIQAVREIMKNEEITVNQSSFWA